MAALPTVPSSGRDLLRNNLVAWLLSGTVCLGGLLLTAGLARAVGHFYQGQLEQRFHWAASERATAMQNSFAAHMADLDGLRRFFTNTQLVTSREFSGYVAGLLPRAFSYAWLPRVMQAERQGFERAARAEGLTDYSIRDLNSSGELVPAALREQYFPLRFVETDQGGSASVLGLDLAALDSRRDTLERARRSAGMAASGVIEFIGTRAGDSDGLLLAAAIYRGPTPGDASARPRTALRGYILAAFSIRQLLREQESAESARNLSLELLETSPLPGRKLQYRSAIAATGSTLQLRRELHLADRSYALIIRPTEAFLQVNSTPVLTVVLGAGLLLSLLMAVLLFVLVSQRQRAHALVGEQTAALRQREAELARVNGQLRGVLDAATQVAVIATDLDGTIRTFNVGAERMLGYSAGEVVGRHSPLLIHLPEEVLRRGQELSLRLGRPVSGFEVFIADTGGAQAYDQHEWTYVRRDGRRLLVNLIVTGIRGNQGELVGYLGIAIDITEAKLSRQALEARDLLLEKLTANVPGAIYQYQLRPDGSTCFPFASAGIRNIYELEPETLRQDASAVFGRIHPEDIEALRRSIQASAELLQPWREEYRVLLPRQGLRWLRGEATPERLGDGSVLWHGYLSDITGPKLVEQELRALSITDALTGAYNRRFFQERLEMEIARARRYAGSLSVVMLDIDHFKLINDRFGHQSGDLVLKEVCARIRQRLRSIDLLCRLGGEEFIVLSPGTAPEQADQLAKALWQILREAPMGEVGRVTASFGVTAWQAGESSDAMLRRVDMAVYQAKQNGRDRVERLP